VTLRFDVSAGDAEVIRATLARLRLRGGFGADCDDGVLLADLARNALVAWSSAGHATHRRAFPRVHPPLPELRKHSRG
jgi:hypothetical protein